MSHLWAPGPAPGWVTALCRHWPGSAAPLLQESGVNWLSSAQCVLGIGPLCQFNESSIWISTGVITKLESV